MASVPWCAIRMAPPSSSIRLASARRPSSLGSPWRTASDMTGEQPRLVFVPGLVSDETVWRPAADLLAPYPVAFADVTQPQSITEMAEHLLAAYAGRLIIAGHSMGGRVALEAA